MGLLSAEARVTDDLFEVVYKWIGRMPGGLVTGTIVACTMFGAVTGLNFAAIGALGKSLIGEMRRRNYNAAMAAATLAASANQGALIPPSILAVFYAFFMDISAGKQIMAGLIPGLLTMFLYMIFVMVRAKLNPEMAPAAKDIKWRDSIAATPKLTGMAVLFIVVVGGLYMGWFTPTEAAAIGTMMALVMVLIRRKFQFEPIKRSLAGTVHLCGMIFVIFLGASAMKFFFTVSGFSQELSDFLGGLDLTIWQLSIVLAVPWLILGMFIDTMTIMVLTLPVYKLIMIEADIDLMVWGIMFIKLNSIASLTPPFGFNVLFTHGIQPDISLWKTYKEALWFVLLDMAIIALVIFFPVIVHFLPDLMG